MVKDIEKYGEGMSDGAESGDAAEEERAAYTITQLNTLVRDLVECSPSLNDVWVTGEISNYKNNYKTGHLYFTLKDDTSVLRSVMFRGSAAKLKFEPGNGMSVMAHGSVTVYLRDGQHMLYCDRLEPVGIGALTLAFEQLKTRLAAEGLFRAEIKRPLPRIPSRIGIVTSPTGAAIRDMINVLGRRFPYAKIYIYPSLVQGDGAAKTIIEGIRYFSASHSVDVVIIGRGGGSMEDLWAFNDEALARAIRASEIPVISAVGHEIDFTISDFAADKRAPTPSAAAELAVPDSSELKKKLDASLVRMTASVSQKLKLCASRLERDGSSRALSSPQRMIDERRMISDSLGAQLESAQKLIMNGKKSALEQRSGKLWALSPMAIIARGYGAVFDAGGRAVRSVGDVGIGDRLLIKLSDGELSAEVEEKKKLDI